MLASAEVITDIVLLAFAGGSLGVAGLALAAFGLFAPHTLPFLHRGRRAAEGTPATRRSVDAGRRLLSELHRAASA